jgi:hypothetical protein
MAMRCRCMAILDLKVVHIVVHNGHSSHVLSMTFGPVRHRAVYRSFQPLLQLGIGHKVRWQHLVFAQDTPTASAEGKRPA